MRLRAVAGPHARFPRLGARQFPVATPAATVVMDDGQLAEAVFVYEAAELQNGVPAHVSLQWQGTDLEYGELDFARYYVQVPPGRKRVPDRIRQPIGDARCPSRPVGGRPRTCGRGGSRGSDTADLILGDGVARVTVRRPGDRWPVAYTILVRAAESSSSQAQTLEGTLVATVSRDANPQPGRRTPWERWRTATLTRGGTAFVLDVARAFSDPDGDVLTYAVVSSASHRRDGDLLGKYRDGHAHGCRIRDRHRDGDRHRGLELDGDPDFRGDGDGARQPAAGAGGARWPR